jgi:hypothetical protein
MRLRTSILAFVLLSSSAARADFREIIVQRFAATPEYLILNLPPRPGAWPGAVFTANMRFPITYGKADDPALHRGSAVSIDAQDGYAVDAGAKVTGAGWFGVSAEAAAVANVVMYFPDAQIVDMSYEDLLHHVEISPEIIAAAKRGQIPVMVVRAYVNHD